MRAIILVVDDEPTARNVAIRILCENGYGVYEADGGAEALSLLNEASGRVDVVLLDVMMHGGDGRKTAQAIRADWPDQRILYTSGYPDEILVERGLKEIGAPFLGKPFTPEELLAKVEETLRRAAPKRARTDHG